MALTISARIMLEVANDAEPFHVQRVIIAFVMVRLDCGTTVFELSTWFIALLAEPRANELAGFDGVLDFDVGAMDFGRKIGTLLRFGFGGQ